MSHDIPKKLLEDVQDIIEQSAKDEKSKEARLFEEGLKEFGAKDFASLSESDQRALVCWVQNKMNMVSIGTGLTEEKEEEEKVEEDCGAEEEPVEEEKDELEDIKEDAAGGVAISPAELASPEPSSAIGQRQDLELPKHADVIKDVDPLSGREDGCRLLIQYPNTRCEIFPPTSIPAAPSLEALLDLVDALPGAEVLVAAIHDAMDLPSNRSQYRGNDLTEDFKKKIKKLI